MSTSADPGSLLTDIGDRPVVMLGEASHGTHEYYTWRMAISRRLIAEKKFRFIAVEGDWPECYRINRYVKGYKDSGDDIVQLLKGFDRWPTWMWAPGACITPSTVSNPSGERAGLCAIIRSSVKSPTECSAAAFATSR